MREGAPVDFGSLRVWPQIGRDVGAQAISLRVLEFAPGLSPGLRNETCDEILYVLGPTWDRGRPARSRLGHVQAANNNATVFIDDRAFAVEPATGIYLRPGQTLTVDNPNSESLVMISSQCPEPLNGPSALPLSPTMPPSSSSASLDPLPIVRLADRPSLPTADRWYRVLVDDEVGSTQVTQFVGSIPPGRAPDHFHQYEEVLFILRGQGRMWAGETNTSIGAGSCVYLPKEQAHCVENTGADELRVLGVFYPAGSPSVRYEVD